MRDPSLFTPRGLILFLTPLRVCVCEVVVVELCRIRKSIFAYNFRISRMKMNLVGPTLSASMVLYQPIDFTVKLMEDGDDDDDDHEADLGEVTEPILLEEIPANLISSHVGTLSTGFRRGGSRNKGPRGHGDFPDDLVLLLLLLILGNGGLRAILG